MSEELDQHDEASVAAAGDGDGSPLSKLSQVSRAMVTIYKDQFGRGPVSARSEWAGPDILVCALEQSFTKAEQNMRDMGEHQRLRDVRMFFQYASVSEFIEPVERITGRKVRSFISGVDTEQDVSAEMFVFYAQGEDGPSRSESA